MKKPHELLKGLTLRWVLVLAILAVGLLANYQFVASHIDQIRSRDQFFTLANRQAMLFQRCGTFFWLLLKTTPLSDRAALQKELSDLVKISEKNYVKLLRAVRFREQVIPPSIQQASDEFLKNLNIFIKTPVERIPHYVSTPNTGFIRRAMVEGQLMTALSDWLEVLRKANDQQVFRFHQWILWMTVMDLLLLGFIGLFIFRPMSRSIARQIEALDHSSTVLAMGQRISHLGSWELELNNLDDIKDNPVTWSDETYRIFGYEPGEVILTNDLFWAIVHRDDRANVEAAMREAITTCMVYHVEHRIRRRDGVERIVIEHADVQWSDGRPVRLIGTVQDITETKILERSLARGAAHQAALYKFVDQLHRAKCIEDIYQGALDAILSALHCDRASIMIFDDSGKMRFLAWRGLSDTYRSALDGHSPWTPDVKEPDPICIPNVQNARIDEYDRQATLKEGINAVAFVPLMCEGRLIGKFKTYYNSPHVFSREETELSLVLARQLAFGIERKHGEDRLKESEENLRLAIEAANVFMWEFDPMTRKMKYSPNVQSVIGFTLSDNADEWLKLLHHEDRKLALRETDAAFRGERPLDLELRMVHPGTGEILWLRAQGRVFPAQGRTHSIMLGITHNVTERRKAEEALRESEARLSAFLEQTPVGLGLVDRNRQWLVVNSALRRFVNETAPSEDPTDPKHWQGWSEEGKPLRRTEWPIVRALGGESVSPKNFIYTADDGREVWTRISSKPFRTAGGKLMGAVVVVEDIDAQKRAEEALHAINERFRRYFELGLIGMAIISPDKRWIEFNEEFCKMLGYSPDEISQKNCSEVTHPEDLPGDVANFNRVVAGEIDGYVLDKRFVGKEGRIISATIAVRGVRNDKGQVEYLLALAQDITERKKAEAELIRLKDKLALDLAAMNRLHELSTRLIKVTHFQTLIEEVLDAAIVLQNADFGTFQICEDNADELKIVAQRGLGQEYMDYYRNAVKVSSASGLALKSRKRVMMEDVEKEEFYGPSRHAAAQSGFRAVLSIPIFGGDGKALGVLSTHFKQPHRVPESELQMTDLYIRLVSELMERKRAEEALRKSEEEFRVIFELSSVGQVQADPVTLRFLKVNKKFSEIIGYSWQELKTLSAYDITHPDDQEMNDMQWLQLLKGEIREFSVEKRYVRQDGSIIWVHVTATILRDSQGRPMRTAAIIQDITQRKIDEDALWRINHELRDLTVNLEKRVEERTRQLEDQTVQLRRLAVELTEAEQTERKRIAQILHDHMQQLLVAARLRLDLLERKIPTENKGAVQDARGFIEQAVQSSRTLTAELRPPVLYEGGLAAALRFLCRKIEDQQKLKANLAVDQDIEPSSDFIKAMVYQSVQELLFNTVKYAGVNECFVKVERAQDRTIHVSVSDEGAGFDPENIGRKGTGGFGLFSIRERIRSLGGDVLIFSAPGKGATFKLIVPDKEEIPEEAKKINREEILADVGVHSRKNGSLRVLLADDHKVVRQLLSGHLKSQPFVKEVIEAEDGEDAVLKAKQFHPDVVIMDLNMPRMNGLEATRILCQGNPDIKVIGLSVQMEHEIAQAMMGAGATAYFNKAEDAAALIEAVRNLTHHD